VLNHILHLIGNKELIDGRLLSHAIIYVYFDNFAFCNTLWHKYEAPMWVEAADKDDDTICPRTEDKCFQECDQTYFDESREFAI